MTSSAEFEEFLKDLQVEARAAAAPEELAAIEAELGCPLPSALREYYLKSDGGSAQHPRAGLEVIPLATARSYLRNLRLAESSWGLFPFIDNHDSNPMSLSCKGPLSGFVVLVNHEDDPRLMFRSLSDLFAALRAFVATGEFYDSHELASDFDGPSRSERDIAIARELARSAAPSGSLPEADKTDALRYACDLLPDSAVSEIEGLSGLGNESVREHVDRRLARIRSPEAQLALAQSSAEFDSFVEACAAQLRAEGMPSTVLAPYGPKALRIDAGPIWLNMEMFFAARAQPNFQAFFVQRAHALLAIKLAKG
ncbi:MAG TPA: SMI1/KNR4 family protein [Polyangiaceae bacterium]